MAQFDYFGTFDDSIDILSAILARRDVRVILGQTFPKPEARFYSTLNAELVGLLKKSPSMYLLGPYSQSPLDFRPIEGVDCEHKYFLAPDGGGPMMHFTFPACFREGSLFLLNVEGMSYTRYYYDKTNDQFPAATPEIKEAYKDFCSRARKCLKRHKVNRSIWIGPRALEMLKMGKARIIAKGV